MSAFFGRQYERIKAKETKALFYALTSGILLTMYSTFYNLIAEDMDKSTVLTMRGLIQITLMGTVAVCNSVSFLPIRENDSDNYAGTDDMSGIGKCNM